MRDIETDRCKNPYINVNGNEVRKFQKEKHTYNADMLFCHMKAFYSSYESSLCPANLYLLHISYETTIVHPIYYDKKNYGN